MDCWVFLMWLGCILSAILCVLYGVYHQFFKKQKDSRKERAEDAEESRSGEDA